MHLDTTETEKCLLLITSMCLFITGHKMQVFGMEYLIVSIVLLLLPLFIVSLLPNSI